MVVEFICQISAFALAISGSFTFWKVQHLYEFYIPIILFIAGYLLGIAISWMIIDITGRVMFSKKKEYTKKPSKIARFWLIQGIWFINHHAMIKLDLRGKEKVPQKSRFLIVCNHRSKFDSMLITEKFGQRDIAFITKESNMKIPLAGRLMIGLRYLPVDRDDKLQSLLKMREAVSLIENDYSSVGVFPEGTRQSTKTIGDFHEGMLNIAIKSRVPIVVITTKGTDQIHKRFPRPTKVRMDVLAIIHPEEYDGMSAKSLSDMIHNMMESHIEEMVIQ